MVQVATPLSVQGFGPLLCPNPALNADVLYAMQRCCRLLTTGVVFECWRCGGDYVRSR